MTDFIRVELGRGTVQIAAQAVAFAEFDAFAHDTGRVAERGGPRRASQANPAVICASHVDAVAYCEWISKRIGHACRLPSMEELDAVMSRDPEHHPDVGVWSHEAGHTTGLVGGLDPLWLCEWTREVEELPGYGDRPGRVLASVFYPPWLREGNNTAHMHAGMLASEGYSFVTFRLSYEG